MPNINETKDIKYDLFISHYQFNGSYLAQIIKSELEKVNKNLNIFLDVDSKMKSIHDLEELVKESQNILLLITENVFERYFVQKELKAAKKYNKNIITLWDRDHCPEFPKKEKLKEKLKKIKEIDLEDKDIENIISILDIKAINWISERRYKNVVIDEIIENMEPILENNNKILNNNNENKKTDSFTSSFFAVTILGFYFVFEIKIYKDKAYFLWNYNKSTTLIYIEFELNDIKNHKSFSIFDNNKSKYINGKEHLFTVNEINNFTFKIRGILPVITIDGTFKIDKHGKIEWIEKNNYNQGIYIETFDNNSVYYEIINKNY